MTKKARNMATIAAALLVLFTTMIDPWLSFGLAIILLIALLSFEFGGKR